LARACRLMQVPQLPRRSGSARCAINPSIFPLKVATMPDFQMNITDLWNVANNQMRLGFTLMATVALDIGREQKSRSFSKKAWNLVNLSRPNSVDYAPDGSAIIQKANPSSK